MQLLATCLALLGLAAAAVTNSSVEYHLHTQLKPGQANKTQYNNLWLSSYHTGAGENDVVFQSAEANASVGFLNTTNQLFDLGNDFPWGLLMDENVNFYAAWEPIRMNAGVSGNQSDVSGFFLNDTGLQWSSAIGTPGGANDLFAGWLVCDWWHGAPQLFFRVKSYLGNTPAPLSCADVDLIPCYI